MTSLIQPGSRSRKFAAILSTITLGAGFMLAAPLGAQAAVTSELVPGQFTSATLGSTIDYTVYLPAGYDAAAANDYATIYLLHGRGDSQAAWQQVSTDLDELIAANAIPPLIAIMPDAPWSNRGNYYVDSLYTGDDAATTPGVAVETAFTTDLIEHIDSTFNTVPDRSARAVGGYSMGGAGALRYVTAHQDLFGSAIVLSPAVYAPAPPVGGSSTMEFGAYGVGDDLFDLDRYQELNYPATFAAFDPADPVHMFIAVGDDEWVNPDPVDAPHDLDYSAATVYNSAKRVSGITAEFRVYDGGHDWQVWRTGFREGIQDLAGYLQTTPPTPLDGTLVGSDGDDRAGGVLANPDGSIVEVINNDGDMLGVENAGGYDAIVRSLDPAGDQVWLHHIASTATDRMYGVAAGTDGAVITAGYTRGNLDGEHPGDNDDALVVGIDSNGDREWLTQFGSATAADRIYAVTSDGEGGVFVAGYTSGSLAGDDNAGDKDAFLARVDGSGAILWTQQIGGTGEDKGMALALAGDGSVYVGGVAGAALPGADYLGGGDGWLALYSSDGEREWLEHVGTSSWDGVSGLAATSTGVAASGYTEGDMSGTNQGSVDAFVLAYTADGADEWIVQEGTPGDDRAAAILTGDADSLLVVGHTSGQIGTSSGGVDIFTLELNAAGVIGERTQFGSAARDGADEWDEANMFLAGDGEDTAWLQGLTAGSIPGTANAGLGDVFLTALPWDNAAAGPDPDPGVIPGGPTGPLGFTGTEAATMLAVAFLLLTTGTLAFFLRRKRALEPAE